MKNISVLGIFVADLSFYSSKIPLRGETILGDDFVVGPGGKGSNQAVAAAKAGCEVNFISKIGKDQYGEIAKKIYKEVNVGSKNVFVTEKFSTGVAAILINKETGDNAISVVPGAAGQLTINDVNNAENEIKNSSIFVTQLESPKSSIIHAIKIAKLNNVITILNPAPAANLDKDVFPLIDFFIPNENEASFYVNNKVANEEDAKHASKYFLNLGVKNVIITLGDKGAYFQNSNDSYYVPALDLKDKVIDTSGAGDAFIGSFAAALCEDKSIRKSIEFANKFAGMSTTKIGTANSMPFRAEIDKLL
jgi:ribokinase